MSDVPECGKPGCSRQARYGYEEKRTCSAGPYTLKLARCEGHKLETYHRGRWNWRKQDRTYS